MDPRRWWVYTSGRALVGIALLAMGQREFPEGLPGIDLAGAERHEGGDGVMAALAFSI